MADGPRLFTHAEATALLPVVTPILRRLQRAKAALDETQQALAALTPAMRGNGHGQDAAQLEHQLHLLAGELTTDVQAIAGHGIELKDLDQGLIDFPAERDGRVVYLCWRLGEEAITHWHELNAGLAGRQPL